MASSLPFILLFSCSHLNLRAGLLARVLAVSRNLRSPGLLGADERSLQHGGFPAGYHISLPPGVSRQA
jgi:hypothetical protein